MPLLSTGLLVKIADGSFRYTTHKAALELLYLPVPIAVKNRTKTFIDVFTDRFSKGIAALIVILVTSVLGLHYTVLSWIMMALALAWIVMTYVVKREYVSAFRDSLLRQKVDADALVINPADPVAVAALAESLQRDQGTAAQNTLRLIAGIQSESLVAPLLEKAHDRDPATARLALDRLIEQSSASAAAGVHDLVDSEDIEVGARSLRVACGPEGVDPLKLGPYLADSRSRVRLAAVLCILRWGGALEEAHLDSELLAQFVADSGAEDDPQATQRLLVALLRDLPAGPESEEYIQKFLSHSDAKVQSEAITAAGRLKAVTLLPLVIDLLAIRVQRSVARESLIAYGESALPSLAQRFADRTSPLRIRESIPRVVALIASPRSAEILMGGLEDPNDRVRFASLRALGRLRAKHPDMVPGTEAVTRRLQEEIRKAYRYQEWMQSIALADETRLLHHTLKEKSRKTIDRIFRLLAMRHPPAELYAASRALLSPNARVRANALEYLDNLLEGRHKKLVLGLVEEKATLDQLRRRLHEQELEPHSWPELLRHQARHPDDWLAAIAVYTVWTSRQEELYGVFSDPEVVDGESKPIARETIDILKQRLAV
jgi:AAA family ATP:ADP antiporter